MKDWLIIIVGGIFWLLWGIATAFMVVTVVATYLGIELPWDP